MVVAGGFVTAWVQRLGIAKALRREAALPEHTASESRKLYCLLLDALSAQAPELLPWAVEGYFWRCWRGLFPEQGVGVGAAASAVPAKTKTKDADVLRERLVRALRKQYKEAVDVKESFVQQDDEVTFTLLAKRASTGRWEELLALERPRLKTARLAAYEAGIRAALEAVLETAMGAKSLAQTPIAATSIAAN